MQWHVKSRNPFYLTKGYIPCVAWPSVPSEFNNSSTISCSSSSSSSDAIGIIALPVISGRAHESSLAPVFSGWESGAWESSVAAADRKVKFSKLNQQSTHDFVRATVALPAYSSDVNCFYVYQYVCTTCIIILLIVILNLWKKELKKDTGNSVFNTMLHELDQNKYVRILTDWTSRLNKSMLADLNLKPPEYKSSDCTAQPLDNTNILYTWHQSHTLLSAPSPPTKHQIVHCTFANA